MADWQDVPKSLEKSQPWLGRLHISVQGTNASQLPNVLKIMATMGYRAHEAVPGSVVMVPGAREAARWCALAAALATVKRGYERQTADGIANLKRLLWMHPDPVFLLDNKHYVQVHCFENDDIRLLWRDGITSNISKHHVLRLQPTQGARRLSKLCPVYIPPINVLDRLLDISAYGNHGVVEDQVIFVSPINHSDAWCRKTRLSMPGDKSGTAICDLLRYGKIDEDGDDAPLAAEAIPAMSSLLFAPDLFRARDYLSEQKLPATLVIDGSRMVKGKEDVLQAILKMNRAVLLFAEPTEFEAVREVVKCVQQLDGAWIWRQEDLTPLLENARLDGTPFADFTKQVRRYARREIKTRQCVDLIVECIYHDLECLKQTLRQQGRKDETDELQKAFYQCVFALSRLLVPIEDDGAITHLGKHMEQIDRAWNAVQKWQIPPQTEAEIRRLRQDLEVLPHFWKNCAPNSKLDTLRLIVGMTAGSSTVLVAEEWEKAGVEAFLTKKLGDQIRKRVRFITPKDIENVASLDGGLVVCGWLGKERMMRLLEGSVAEKITLLLYPFEYPWYDQSRRRKIDELPHDEMAKMLGLPAEAVPTPAAPPNIPSPPAAAAASFPTTTATVSDEEEDGADYVVQLQRETLARKISRLRTADADQSQCVEARAVLFAGDRYAYLGAERRVPVATGWMTGQAGSNEPMPMRRPDELVPGDYVVFRESGGSLISEMADRILHEKGLSGARKTARIWRDALKEFRFAYPPGRQGEKQVVTALKRRGVAQQEQTVRAWFREDNDIIGPTGEDTLNVLARVTQYALLEQRANEVRAAVRDVRGAHGSAATELARQLTTALNKRLTGRGDEDLSRFDVAGVGSAVVARVEAVLPDTHDVPPAHVGHLRGIHQ